ncbi:DUF7692 domain-containing protein [Haladaptatus sp. NG-WS-4]
MSRKVPSQVRIRTGEGNEHRYDAIVDAKQALGETNNTSAVVGACEHARQDVQAKRKAMKYLEQRLTPQELEKVADLLSTRELPIDYSRPRTSIGSK